MIQSGAPEQPRSVSLFLSQMTEMSGSTSVSTSLRALPLPLEQPDSEGSGIDFALLSPQILMELG